jgi:glyceraldehyde-3-phosphate dehydrogenase (EC 1.2.1.12)
LTTVHAYTGSQALIDSPMTKTRRGRAAAENIIPTSTGAAQATTEILPQLDGKLDGMAMRVPVPNGSITELVVNLSTAPSVEVVNDAFRNAADDGPLAGVLGYTDDEVVSSDIIGLPFSSMVDLNSTNQVNAGGLYKILTWYDNEFGFSNRMLDLAQFITNTNKYEYKYIIACIIVIFTSSHHMISLQRLLRLNRQLIMKLRVSLYALI